MESLLRALEPAGGRGATAESLLLALLLAFVLGQVVAFAYSRTHAGLSYSRTFTQSLVLIAMVVAMVMHVVGDSIVTAFGLIGALAIIRFRNVLKDTRDTVFVFFALVLGLALGVEKHTAAMLGTAALVAAAIYLHVTSFGSRGSASAHLSCRFTGSDAPPGLHELVRAFCRSHRALARRRDGAERELVWAVHLRDRERGDELAGHLRALPGVTGVALVELDELSEA